MIRDSDYYNEEYVKKERSTYDIADETGTYANKIRRELRHYGYELRNRSEAQTAALKYGRHPHPKKGKVNAENSSQGTNG